MPEPKLKHLLKPKQFRVWCRPNNIPGDFDVTTEPSKTTCSRCLTWWRRSIRGSRFRDFSVRDTLRPPHHHQ